MSRPRSYVHSDLGSLQELVMEGARQFPHRGYLHPGDIPHHIYNALKLYDPAEVVYVWEASAGVETFGIAYPGDETAIDLQVDRRVDISQVGERVEFLVDAAVRVSRSAGKDPRSVGADLCEGDDAAIALHTGLGFSRHDPMYAITTRSLKGRPHVDLPPGFIVRSVRVEEADAVGQLHADSFGSTWDTGMYARVMTAPGYDPARELVMEAPDGRLAGFTVMWLDDTNAIGLFEPVGTSQDFRRHGVARNLMAAGMAQMAESGMTTAMVLHEIDNEASSRLYASLGFERARTIVDYQRPVD